MKAEQKSVSLPFSISRIAPSELFASSEIKDSVFLSSVRCELGQADFPRWVGFDPLQPLLIVAIPDAETVGATSTQACHFQKREREEDTILAFIPSKPLVTIQNDDPISNKRLCFCSSS